MFVKPQINALKPTMNTISNISSRAAPALHFTCSPHHRLDPVGVKHFGSGLSEAFPPLSLGLRPPRSLLPAPGLCRKLGLKHPFL